MNPYFNIVSKNYQKLLVFVFKILRFADYQKFNNPRGGKKRMKRKTLHGIRHVNKKIIKNKMVLLWPGPSLVCYKLPEKETNNSDIVAFFSELDERRLYNV